MFMLASFACALTASVMPQAPDRVDAALPKYPVAALVAAVDLPTRALRAAAAVQLAKRSVPLKQWHEAAGKLRLRASMGARVDAQTLRYDLRIHVMHAFRPAVVLVRTPGGPPAKGPQPVLFCWHGAGGDGASAMRTWSTLADRFGLLLVAPTESYEPYRKEGWSFHPDGYEGVQEVLRFVRRHYDVDEDRIVLAGVRGGGHMAWDCGLRFADQFAAIAPANGSPRLGNPNRDSNMMFLESIAHVPVRSLHWGPQEEAQTENVKRSLVVLRRFGSTTAVRLEYESQLHALNPNGVGWAEFLATRRTVPQKLVKFPDRAWVPHRREFGRHHWLEVLAYDRTVRQPFPPKVVAAK